MTCRFNSIFLNFLLIITLSFYFKASAIDFKKLKYNIEAGTAINPFIGDFLD